MTPLSFTQWLHSEMATEFLHSETMQTAYLREIINMEGGGTQIQALKFSAHVWAEMKQQKNIMQI